MARRMAREAREPGGSEPAAIDGGDAETEIPAKWAGFKRLYQRPVEFLKGAFSSNTEAIEQTKGEDPCGYAEDEETAGTVSGSNGARLACAHRGGRQSFGR